MAKSLGLAKAALLLIEKGFPDEAFDLSRTLVECSVGLRYMTADADKQEERTNEFMDFGETDRNYWLHQARKYLSGSSLKTIESSRQARELDAKKLNPMRALRHWSSLRGAFIWEAMTKFDHPLDGTTNTQKQREADYAVDYHAPSQYVHCSERGFNSYGDDPIWIHDASDRLRVRVPEDTAQKTLYILCQYLHATVCYAFFGLNVDRPQQINKLYSRVIAQLKPIRSSSP